MTEVFLSLHSKEWQDHLSKEWRILPFLGWRWKRPSWSWVL